MLALIAVTFFVLIFNYLNSYNFYKFYKENFAKVIPYEHFERILFQFDFNSALKKRTYSPSADSINIELDSEDILDFRDLYFSSFLNYEDIIKDSEVGFIPDNKNEWKKSKVMLGSNEQKVKVKIHGTSRGPVRASFTLPNHIKTILSDEVKKEYIDISKAGYAFKIKIDSDDKFYNGMRRINLLSPYDDWTIVQNAINKYISSMNIITAHGTLTKLHINGILIGPYLMQEQIGKEILERNYQITNYALLKSNDDWNKSFYQAHIGTTDYTTFDKEQSGEPVTIAIATDLLNKLLKGIQNKNIDTIYNLMDIDNLAKVAAIIKLTGSVSPLHGDNTKYIYNIAKGKFQFVYRLEGAPTSLESLSPANFDLDSYNNINYHKVFDILINDNEFLELRNKYLSQLIKDKDFILKLIQDEYINSRKFLEEINFPTNSIKFQYLRDLTILEGNFKYIKDYLNYSKIYTTVHTAIDNKIYLKILNDSYTSSYLQKITSCDNKDYNFNNLIKLNTPTYSRIDGYMINENFQIIESPFRCIKSLDVKKEYSVTSIDYEHLYFNYSTEVEYYDNLGLDAFGNGLIEQNLSNDSNYSKKYLLKKGDYFINHDVIFPNNSILTIEPGAKLVLGKGVSVLVRGSLVAKGKNLTPITVTNDDKSNFGSFAVIGSSHSKNHVVLEFFYIKGGNEEIINGAYYSGQASFHNVDVSIKNSIFENSISDDGLNIKFGKVTIIDSVFRNNFGDQIDLDYTTGIVMNNTFSINSDYMDTFISDGLDVSGSKIKIKENTFVNMTDKGISVGESSDVYVENNTLNNNNMAIAAKDNSKACLNNNYFNENNIDISAYIKKKMYAMPTIYLMQQSYKTKNILNKNNIEINNYIFPQCDKNYFLAS